MKQFIKSLVPPIVIDIYRKYNHRKYGWKGDYSSWTEAKRASTGYDSDEILQKVKSSLLKVKNGQSVYERDSVIFDEIQYSWPLLAGLMFASAKSKGVIRVLDFGGSLGSTYYQNKKFLDEFDDVSWNIVEQKEFVELGKAEFADNRLKFYDDIGSCVDAENPNIIILSSVLQYISEPYNLLDKILDFNFEFLIFDRTPFSLTNHDMIKLQVVPENIYNASYPCWFFSFSKLMSRLKKKYELIEVFDGNDGKNNLYEFKGFIMRRKYD